MKIINDFLKWNLDFSQFVSDDIFDWCVDSVGDDVFKDVDDESGETSQDPAQRTQTADVNVDTGNVLDFKVEQLRMRVRFQRLHMVEMYTVNRFNEEFKRKKKEKRKK